MTKTFYLNQESKDLTLIIPAYNESKRVIPTLIAFTDFFNSLQIDYEIIVVDDGSTDETSDIVKDYFNKSEDRYLLSYSVNKGKGYAVNLGVRNARGKLIIFADADGATKVNDYLSLLNEIDAGFDIAIGSRAIPQSGAVLKAKSYRVLMGRVFNFIVNFLCVPKVMDTQCGFKLFKRDAAELVFSRQRINGFAFDCEILFIASRNNLKISEVAVNWSNVEGSKVNLLIDPFLMMIEIIKIRLNQIKGVYR